MKSALAEFILGEEFIETTIDGRKMKTTFTIATITDTTSGMEYDALLQTQIDSSDRKIEVVRFIHNGKLQVIMMVNGTPVGRALFQSA